MPIKHILDFPSKVIGDTVSNQDMIEQWLPKGPAGAPKRCHSLHGFETRLGKTAGHENRTVAAAGVDGRDVDLGDHVVESELVPDDVLVQSGLGVEEEVRVHAVDEVRDVLLSVEVGQQGQAEEEVDLEGVGDSC